MKKQIIFMYSGQGSQYYQMGKELYENHSKFRQWMDQCNEIVQPIIKTSLTDILYRGKGKGEPFDNVLHTKPALLCIQYSLTKVLNEMNIQPDFLMGYSVGELVAAVASEAVSLEDGIRLAVDIARLTDEKTQPAAMLAVMGQKSLMTDYSELFHDCWLTAENFTENFVVSGLPLTIQQLHGELNKKSIMSQILPVKYGFHTELIDPIEEECKQLVHHVSISAPKVPMISSLNEGIVQQPDGDYLWKAIRHPVNFHQTVRRVLDTGDYIFIDVGPSGTLATFVKYILPPDSGSVSLQVLNQFGRDLLNIDRLKANLLSHTY
ncbi:acyltransferase domain-containing protein [Fulvivirga kasyanovii]|uniref:Acyltransferase domain-containing protein n=1 Tax=Fulvivirga kasyanovii TaxID=396812 RepID=A0ABW9RYS2_9BACT|nr:acyltransferase domain-containing protein [Fulvivirga kasyanovii]MTI29173.1 acyltransferase domain-containing protein [Fulvivirga kasyanovii]